MNLDRNPWMARGGRAAFALALVLAVGCGDDGSGTDDGSESDTTANTPTSTPTSTTTSDPTATGTDSTAGDTGSDSGTEDTGTPVTVDYMADIQPIWDTKCVAGCHIETGIAQQAGPILTAEKSYDALIDVPSPTVADIVQVKPGSTDESYLWHKVAGTFANVGGLGLQMPQGGMLTEEELGKIEAWIDEGAKP